MSTDYYNKYLKYKSKYFRLKNNGKYNTSTQHYISDIKEFCEDTFDTYKNCEETWLNRISWYTTEGSALPIELKKNLDNIIDKENPITNEFLTRALGNENMIYIEGFYNNKGEYPNNPAGTFVSQEKIPEIFTNPELIPISNVATSYGTKRGFYASKGSGKKNLHQFALNMKCLGYNYIVLSAEGGADLVSMYENYGFRKLIKNKYQDEDRYSMFGLVSEIIEKTR